MFFVADLKFNITYKKLIALIKSSKRLHSVGINNYYIDKYNYKK